METIIKDNLKNGCISDEALFFMFSLRVRLPGR
jgi:hypothetical protein